MDTGFRVGGLKVVLTETGRHICGEAPVMGGEVRQGHGTHGVGDSSPLPLDGEQVVLVAARGGKYPQIVCLAHNFFLSLGYFMQRS